MKCSFHIGKKFSIKHNTRSFNKEEWNRDEHIDYNRTHLNEIYINERLPDFFGREFGNALVEYNKKNISKHPDRLIGFSSAQEYNGCSEVERKNRAVAAYYHKHKDKIQEAIIQIGNHDDYMALVKAVGQETADKIHKDYLTRAFAVWREQNPSFAVFHASAHLDEIKDGTPHLHIDFIPIAESERGLSRKVSMDGALKNMGYERVKGHKYAETPYKLWLSTFRAHQEGKAQEFIESRTELKNLGLTVEPSEPSKASHTEPPDYKLRNLRNAEKRLKEINSEIAESEKKLSNIKKETLEYLEKHSAYDVFEHDISDLMDKVEDFLQKSGMHIVMHKDDLIIFMKKIMKKIKTGGEIASKSQSLANTEIKKNTKLNSDNNRLEKENRYLREENLELKEKALKLKAIEGDIERLGLADTIVEEHNRYQREKKPPERQL